jgi:RNA polymerase sigma factor (sigma-70 family)
VGTGDGGNPKLRESLSELHRSPCATPGAPAPMPDHSRAVAEMFRSHHTAQVRFVAARVGSVEDAQEIVQEAYVRTLAMERPGTIRFLPGYLWRIAMNLAINHRKQQADRGRLRHAAPRQFTEDEPSADRLVEGQERLAIVERALKKLPPKCREAFVLHVLRGLKFHEVSRVMGISERMAYKHVGRALEYLQLCLDGDDEPRSAP